MMVRYDGRTVLYEYNGHFRSIIQWAALYGMKPNTLYDRLVSRRMPIKEALSTPIDQTRVRKRERPGVLQNSV